MGNLNTPSYNFLIPREHRIRAIQELYEAINKVSDSSTIIDASSLDSASLFDLKVGSLYNINGDVFIPTSKDDSELSGYVITSDGISLMTIDSNGDAASTPIVSKGIVQVNHGTNDTTFTLSPNEFHVWGEIDSLEITFGAETSGYMNEYMFEFISGVTPTILTLPSSVIFPEDYEIEANKKYQVSIVDNIGLIVGVDYE